MAGGENATFFADENFSEVVPRVIAQLRSLESESSKVSGTKSIRLDVELPKGLRQDLDDLVERYRAKVGKINTEFAKGGGGRSTLATRYEKQLPKIEREVGQLAQRHGVDIEVGAKLAQGVVGQVAGEFEKQLTAATSRFSPSRVGGIRDASGQTRLARQPESTFESGYRQSARRTKAQKRSDAAAEAAAASDEQIAAATASTAQSATKLSRSEKRRASKAAQDERRRLAEASDAKPPPAISVAERNRQQAADEKIVYGAEVGKRNPRHHLPTTRIEAGKNADSLIGDNEFGFEPKVHQLGSSNLVADARGKGAARLFDRVNDGYVEVDASSAFFHQKMTQLAKQIRSQSDKLTKEQQKVLRNIEGTIKYHEFVGDNGKPREGVQEVRGPGSTVLTRQLPGQEREFVRQQAGRGNSLGYDPIPAGPDRDRQQRVFDEQQAKRARNALNPEHTAALKEDRERDQFLKDERTAHKQNNRRNQVAAQAALNADHAAALKENRERAQYLKDEARAHRENTRRDQAAGQAAYNADHALALRENREREHYLRDEAKAHRENARRIQAAGESQYNRDHSAAIEENRDRDQFRRDERRAHAENIRRNDASAKTAYNADHSAAIKQNRQRDDYLRDERRAHRENTRRTQAASQSAFNADHAAAIKEERQRAAYLKDESRAHRENARRTKAATQATYNADHAAAIKQDRDRDRYLRDEARAHREDARRTDAASKARFNADHSSAIKEDRQRNQYLKDERSAHKENTRRTAAAEKSAFNADHAVALRENRERTQYLKDERQAHRANTRRSEAASKTTYNAEHAAALRENRERNQYLKDERSAHKENNRRTAAAGESAYNQDHAAAIRANRERDRYLKDEASAHRENARRSEAVQRSALNADHAAALKQNRERDRYLKDEASAHRENDKRTKQSANAAYNADHAAAIKQDRERDRYLKDEASAHRENARRTDVAKQSAYNADHAAALKENRQREAYLRDERSAHRENDRRTQSAAEKAYNNDHTQALKENKQRDAYLRDERRAHAENTRRTESSYNRDHGEANQQNKRFDRDRADQRTARRTELDVAQQGRNRDRLKVAGTDELQSGVKRVGKNILADTNGTFTRFFEETDQGAKELEVGSKKFLNAARDFERQAGKDLEAAAKLRKKNVQRQARENEYRGLFDDQGQLRKGVERIGDTDKLVDKRAGEGNYRYFQEQDNKQARRIDPESVQYGRLDRQANSGGVLNSFLRGFTGSSFQGAAKGAINLKGALEGVAQAAGTTAKYTLLGTALYLMTSAFSAAVGEVLDFEDSVENLKVALDNVGTGAKLTTGTLNSLANSASQAGANVGQSLDLAATAVRALADTTDGSQDALNRLQTNFAETASKLAVISNTDIKTAADNLQAMALAFDIPDASFSRVLDVIAGAKSLGGGNEDDIATGLANIGVQFKELGFSAEETGAIISKVQSETAESGTLIASRLTRATSILGGSEGTSALRKLNTGLDPSQQVDTTADTKTKILQLAKVYNTLSDAQRSSLINSLGGATAARELIVTLQNAQHLITEADKGFTGKGAEEFDRLLNNIRGTLTQIQGNLKNIVAAFANTGVLDPLFGLAKYALLPALEAVRLMLQTFNLIPRPARQLLFLILEVAAAMAVISRIGKTDVFAGMLAGARALLVTMRGVLAEAIAAASINGIGGGIATFAKTLFAAITSGVGLFTAGLAAAAVAIYAFQKNLEINSKTTGLNELSAKRPADQSSATLRDTASNLKAASDDLRRTSGGFFGTPIHYAGIAASGLTGGGFGDKAKKARTEADTLAAIYDQAADAIDKAKEAAKEAGDVASQIDTSNADNLSSSIDDLSKSGYTATQIIQGLTQKFDQMVNTIVTGQSNLTGPQITEASQTAATSTGTFIAANQEALKDYNKYKPSTGPFRTKFFENDNMAPVYDYSGVDQTKLAGNLSTTTQSFLTKGVKLSDGSNSTDINNDEAKKLLIKQYQDQYTAAGFKDQDAKDAAVQAYSSVRTDVNKLGGSGLEDILVDFYKDFVANLQAAGAEASTNYTRSGGGAARGGVFHSAESVNTKGQIDYLQHIIDGDKEVENKYRAQGNDAKADEFRQKIAQSQQALNQLYITYASQQLQDMATAFQLLHKDDAQENTLSNLQNAYAELLVEGAAAKASGNDADIAANDLAKSQNKQAQAAATLASKKAKARTKIDPRDEVANANQDVVDAQSEIDDLDARHVKHSEAAYQEALQKRTKAQQDSATAQAERNISARAAAQSQGQQRDSLLQATNQLKDDQELLATLDPISTAYNNQLAKITADKVAVADKQSELAKAIRNQNVLTNSSLDTAQRAVKDARDEVAKYTDKTSVEYINAMTALNTALGQQASALADAAYVKAQLGIDLSNPVQVANAAVDDAQKRLALAKEEAAKATDSTRAAKEQEVGAAQLDLRTKQNNAEAAEFQQFLSAAQTADQLQRVSHRAYLNILKGRRDLLKAELAGLDPNSNGYQQIKDQIDQLDGAIKAGADALTGQFNIGDIKIPTPYEVRKAIKEKNTGTVLANNSAQGTAGNVTNDNSQKSIVLNGVPIQQVMTMIEELFGVKTRTAVNRKVV